MGVGAVGTTFKALALSQSPGTRRAGVGEAGWAPGEAAPSTNDPVSFGPRGHRASHEGMDGASLPQVSQSVGRWMASLPYSLQISKTESHPTLGPREKDSPSAAPARLVSALCPMERQGPSGFHCGTRKEALSLKKCGEHRGLYCRTRQSL